MLDRDHHLSLSNLHEFFEPHKSIPILGLVLDVKPLKDLIVEVLVAETRF